MTVGFYATAFLDIMGQGDELKSLTVPRSDPERKKVEEVLQRTIKPLLSVRAAFNAFFERACGPMSPEMLSLLPEDARESFDRVRGVKPHCRGFSDSLVIDIALLDDDVAGAVGPMRLLAATLHALSGLSLSLLSNRIAVRGGIEVGTAVALDDGEVYGNSLRCAHHLESKVAVYPRILVGPELEQYLDFIKMRPGAGTADLIARALVPRVQSFLMVDPQDGLPMVNPRQGADAGELQKARSWVESEEKRFAMLGDEKLRGKYASLQRILD